MSRRRLLSLPPLLTASEMDAAFRHLLSSTSWSGPISVGSTAALKAAHVEHLASRYGLHAGGGGTPPLGVELLRSWRAPWRAVEPQLPRLSRRMLSNDLDAIFIPALDWDLRIVGGALKDLAPDAPSRYLTLGDQYDPSARRQRRGTGGFASLRVGDESPAGAGAFDLIEPPLHVSRPSAPPSATAGRRWVGLCEGALKSMVAAQAFGVPVLAEWISGSGQFYRSPTQLRALLRRAAEEEGAAAAAALGGGRPTVVLLADAGCTSNPGVALHYVKTLQLLVDWGEAARVGWWGQAAKRDDGGGPGDIDELLLSMRGPAPSLEAAMEMLTPGAFEAMLVGEAAARVARWRRETALLTMAEAVEWQAVRVPAAREET